MSPRTLSRPGKLYVYAVILAGASTIIASSIELASASIGHRWLILAALTIFSGSATVKLPSIPASLSVSETFVFTSVILFGAPVGTLIVALDGLIISLWLNRRRKEFYRLLFNISAPAVSIWISAKLFFVLAGIPPLLLNAPEHFQIPDLPLGALAVFTVVYFLLNSWLIAFAVSFETSQPAITIWRSNFAWLSLNFLCGASVATLFLTIVLRSGKIDITTFLTYLGAMLPLLLVLYLTYRTSMARVEDANRHLNEINQMYLATIETLALAIDAKDQVTHGHIRRVQTFAVALTRQLAGGDRGLLHAMEAASLLHDMGKLAVPEHILNKPGKLTAAEFDRMKVHASIGADILSSIHFPYPVIPIVRHHHENWDGSGYPDGLSGTNIPLGARILSVVDCYDALTSDRPYRPRLTNEQAIAILMQRRGGMYDPLIVDTFVHALCENANERDDKGGDGNPAILDLARRIAHNSRVIPSQRLRSDALQSSTRFLELCSVIDGLAIQSNSLTNAMAIIAPCLTSAIASDLIVLFLYDPQRDDLTVAYVSRPIDASFYHVRILLGEQLAGWVGATRQTALNSNPSSELERFVVAHHSTFQSCLMVPLTLDDSLVGTIGFYSVDIARYTHGDQQFAELLSGHLAWLVRKMSHLTASLVEITQEKTIAS
jgi:putative methionine-R-sulfoxide reductase with GAF domain